MSQRRLSQAFQAVLLSSAVILLGCSGEDGRPTTSNPEVMTRVGIDGVTVLFPASFGDTSIRSENDVTTLRWNEHSVELDDGKFSFDGKLYGMVESGDVVTIAEDGTVSIDGRVSTPHSESTGTLVPKNFNAWC